MSAIFTDGPNVNTDCSFEKSDHQSIKDALKKKSEHRMENWNAAKSGRRYVRASSGLGDSVDSTSWGEWLQGHLHNCIATAGEGPHHPPIIHSCLLIHTSSSKEAVTHEPV